MIGEFEVIFCIIIFSIFQLDDWLEMMGFEESKF